MNNNLKTKQITKSERPLLSSKRNGTYKLGFNIFVAFLDSTARYRIIKL